MDEYRFKAGQELLWIALTAGALAALQIAASTDPATITDWKTYAVALGGAAFRAAAAAVYNGMVKVADAAQSGG